MSGYPSLEEAIHLMHDHNVQNMPNITCAAIERAYNIHGTPPEYVQGKLTKKTVGRLRVDDMLREEIKNQHVYTDIMHVDDGVRFLVSVAVPLYLMLQCKIENEGSTEVGMALQAHLAILRSN
jgi:hypothetical protein